MQNLSIVIVVAVSTNGVIGRDGDLPWRLPTDLKRFKALTLGKPVVMGRRTWASIGRALPGRPNIVVTRDAAFVAPGAEVVGSLQAGLDLAARHARDLGVDEICVIGGGDIYRQTMSLVDIIHVTEVADETEGDTHFPHIAPAVFEKVFEEELPKGEKDSHAMRFVTWRRKTP